MISKVTSKKLIKCCEMLNVNRIEGCAESKEVMNVFRSSSVLVHIMRMSSMYLL